MEQVLASQLNHSARDRICVRVMKHQLEWGTAGGHPQPLREREAMLSPDGLSPVSQQPPEKRLVYVVVFCQAPRLGSNHTGIFLEGCEFSGGNQSSWLLHRRNWGEMERITFVRAQRIIRFSFL